MQRLTTLKLAVAFGGGVEAVLRPAILSFMPMAPDIATCLYYTGIDPFTKKEVHVAKGRNDRKMQRTLMQFFKPENYFTVREALIKAG